MVPTRLCQKYSHLVNVKKTSFSDLIPNSWITFGWTSSTTGRAKIIWCTCTILVFPKTKAAKTKAVTNLDKYLNLRLNISVPGMVPSARSAAMYYSVLQM